MQYKFLFLAPFGVLVFFGIKISSASAACVNPTPVTGFAAPCPVLSLSATSTSATGTISVIATPGTRQYVHQTFYIWNGSNWQSQAFNGTFKNSYATTTVSSTLTSTILGSLPSGTIYLASWDWTYNTSSNCFTGPSSTTCGSGFWRLQAFQLTGVTGTPCSGGGGPPNYCAYTGSDIVQLPNPLPDLGNLTKNNAVVYDTSYVAHGESSANLSPIIRCTDINTIPGGTAATTYSAGLGGSGAGILWNTNSTLLHINAGSLDVILRFNPSTLQCSTAITQAQNISNPGSASRAQAFGGGSFSLSNPNIWYSMNQANQVVPYSIDPTTGNFAIGTPLADLSLGLPIGANAPAWQPNHAYQYGDYVSYALTSAQAPDWQSNSSAYNIGDIIVPQTNNPNGCAYKKWKAGPTGSSTPNWISKCNMNPVADGGINAMWKGLGGPAAFVYQLTSGSGTSGSATPAFVPANGHPDLMTTISDNGLTWTNVGVDATSTGLWWNSFGAVSRDGMKTSAAMSINSYGYAGDEVGWGGGQDTAITDVSYDGSTNTYHLFNTGTGIMTDFVCSVGASGGYNCNGGNFVQKTLGQVANGCRFFIHNDKASTDGNYVAVALKSLIVGTNAACNLSVWRPNQSPFDPNTQLQMFPGGLGHWAFGKSSVVSNGLGGNQFGYYSGYYMVKGSLANPQDTAQMYGVWHYNPSGPAPACDPNPNWPPNDALPPCATSIFDSHVSWAYNPADADNTPVCFSHYGYTLRTTGNPMVTPWENEEMCVSTDTTVPSSQRQWRFTHTFATQTNNDWNTQFEISQESQDGQFMAWTTDYAPSPVNGAGSFGSTSGGSTCKGGFPWQANFNYAAGQMINPIGGLSGSAPVFDVFQATAVTGPSGSTPPSWGNYTQGQTVQDGGITWQDIGTGDCRGEVLVVKMK